MATVAGDGAAQMAQPLEQWSQEQAEQFTERLQALQTPSTAQ
jgi:hypothetical protein